MNSVLLSCQIACQREWLGRGLKGGKAQRGRRVIEGESDEKTRQGKDRERKQNKDGTSEEELVARRGLESEKGMKGK